MVLAVFSAVIVAGAGIAHAVTIIYEPFDDSNPSLTGNTPGMGLTGTWSASSQFVVGADSLTYGSLSTSGNQVIYGTNGTGNSASSVNLGNDANDAGLLSDGATLWFSVVVTTPIDGGSNPDTGFAIGTDQLGSGNNLPMPSGGEGIGWTIKTDKLQATVWNTSLARTAGPAVSRNTTILIVGEINWGAASDTINLYLPDTNLNKGSVKVSTSGALNQGAFTKITSSLKTNTGYGFDEIRFGSTYEDVLIFPTLSWDLDGNTPGSGADGGGAAAGTWNAAGKNWNPELDGSGDANAWLPGYVARFAAGSDANGTYAVTVEGQHDIWGLAFDEGNVTLAPGAGGELRLVKNSAEVDVASGLIATVATQITDDANSRALTKKGAGTLILSGANTYGGGTNVRAGTLVLGAGDALPSGTDVIVGGNVAGMTATLDANGHSLTIGSLTLGGATATSAAAVATGAGTLTLGGDVTYDNANNPLGATISGKLALGADARTFTINDSASTAAELTVSADISGTVGLIKEGAGMLVLSGNNVDANGGMAVNAGAVQFESPAAINGTNRDVTVNAGGAVVFGPSFETGTDIPTALLTRIVADSHGAIAADNYDANDFDFSTPGLTAASLGAVGNVSYTGTLTPNGAPGSAVYRLGGGGGTLTMADANAVTGSGNSLVVVGPGTVVIANANDADGATTVSAGATLQIGNGSTAGSLSPGSAITVDGTLVFKRSDTITQGTDFGAGITGSGTVIKDGTGTLVLNAANAVSGLTVRKGTVQLGAGATLALDTLTFDSGATTISGGTLNFAAGGSITNAVLYSQTITSSITGSPSVAITDNQSARIYFSPTGDATQTLGTITAPYEGGGNSDKCELHLGGTTTGNTVASIVYQTSPDNHYGYMHKEGSGTWTVGDVAQGALWVDDGTLIINGTFTSLYQGLKPIPSGARLGGNLTYYESDARFGYFEVSSGGIVSPGDPSINNGIGKITTSWGNNVTNTATTTFKTGSIYEWQIGGDDANGNPTTDTVHVFRSTAGSNNNRSLIVEDGMILKIFDAGATVGASDHLPVFTYDAGVVRTVSLASVVFDTSALDLGIWTIGTLSLTDDNAGTIYLTGLSNGTLLGDTNDDGVVDAADYLAVKQNFGLTTGATLAQGNVDDDGDVDWDDLQVVMTNFGAGAGTAPAKTPEPATLGLLAIGALAVLRRNRRS
jgi:autotransporter-associated beta strand protein